MTDPIQVLRDMGPTHMYRSPEHIERWDAALAQVEALVEAAKHVTFAIWMSDGDEEAAAGAFVAALAPFKEGS